MCSCIYISENVGYDLRRWSKASYFMFSIWNKQQLSIFLWSTLSQLSTVFSYLISQMPPRYGYVITVFSTQQIEWLTKINSFGQIKSMWKANPIGYYLCICHHWCRAFTWTPWSTVKDGFWILLSLYPWYLAKTWIKLTFNGTKTGD